MRHDVRKEKQTERTCMAGWLWAKKKTNMERSPFELVKGRCAKPEQDADCQSNTYETIEKQPLLQNQDFYTLLVFLDILYLHWNNG